MSPIPPTKINEILKRAETSLNRLRPALQADGGDAKIVELSPDGVLTLELMGACGDCAMSKMTLRQGLERVIKHDIPEITAVESTQQI